MKKKLAKIKEVSLNTKNGFLTFSVLVDYEEGCSQNIGNFSLDDYDKKTKQRIGTAFGCEMLRQIITNLNVYDFYKLKNEIVWVLVEDDFPVGLQALSLNGGGKPVVFKEVYNLFNL